MLRAGEVSWQRWLPRPSRAAGGWRSGQPLPRSHRELQRMPAAMDPGQHRASQERNQLLCGCSSPKSNTPTSTPVPSIPTATEVPLALKVNGEGITLSEYQAELSRLQKAQSDQGITATAAQQHAVVTAVSGATTSGYAEAVLLY